MKPSIVLACGLAVVGAGTARTWSFDKDSAERPPAGWVIEQIGGGAPAKWVVRAEKDAPSGPNVLAQLDTDDTDARFPVAVAGDSAMKDLRLSVKCKMISGNVDRACGLVFRYRDANNYYITRANVLENNIRFYYVKDGRRKQLASWSGKVTGGAWHELRAEARGDSFTIYWDDAKVLAAKDSTFGEAGRVGVWTKADSVTYFDDLTAQELAP